MELCDWCGVGVKLQEFDVEVKDSTMGFVWQVYGVVVGLKAVVNWPKKKNWSPAVLCHNVLVCTLY